MKCPKCHNDVPDSAKVCGYCGTKLGTDNKLFCTHCGKEIPASAKACGYCGAKQEKPPAAAAALPQEEVVQDTASRVREAAPAKAPRLPRWVLPALAGVACVAVVALVILMRPKTPPPPEAPAQQAPAATPQTSAPTPEAVDNKELLYDDFSDPFSGWPVFSHFGSDDVGYAGKAYRFVFHKQMGFNAAWSPLEYGDCVVETEIKFPKNRDIGAGLTLRTTDKNWYLVFIYPNSREFSFWKTIDGVQTEVIGREFSEAIAPVYEDGKILLKAVLSGDTIEIYTGSNSSDYALVAAVEAAELSSGHLGPAAIPPEEPFKNNPVQIFFYWIKISAN